MTTENKLRVLTRIAETLNSHGITWGVGASLLLNFKSITQEFHDIDLMTTAEDVEQVKELLSGLGELQPPNPNDRYFSRHFYEFVIDGVDVDVMEGFVIVHDGQKINCPFSADSIAETIELDGQKIPLQAVPEWRRYYALMGREAKVNMIDQALEQKEV